MEVTLKQFADKYNEVLTRRGFKMSEGYLYRLIRENEAGNNTRKLWFKYKFEGNKNSIRILID